MTSPGLTTKQYWPPKPATDTGRKPQLCHSNFLLLLKNLSYSQSIRPLSISQWNTALCYGMTPKNCTHLFCIPVDNKQKLSSGFILESPTMRLKHKVCCSHVLGRSVVSLFLFFIFFNRFYLPQNSIMQVFFKLPLPG